MGEVLFSHWPFRNIQSVIIYLRFQLSFHAKIAILMITQYTRLQNHLVRLLRHPEQNFLNVLC